MIGRRPVAGGRYLLGFIHPLAAPGTSGFATRTEGRPAKPKSNGGLDHARHPRTLAEAPNH